MFKAKDTMHLGLKSINFIYFTEKFYKPSPKLYISFNNLSITQFIIFSVFSFF